MSVRRLRSILTYAVVILASLTAKHLYDQWRLLSANERNAAALLELCDLPPLPEGLIVHHAAIAPTPDRQYLNVALTLGGDQNTLDAWLEKVDTWADKRPGKILNHTLREAENASRIDFSAEVFSP